IPGNVLRLQIAPFLLRLDLSPVMGSAEKAGTRLAAQPFRRLQRRFHSVWAQKELHHAERENVARGSGTLGGGGWGDGAHQHVTVGRGSAAAAAREPLAVSRRPLELLVRTGPALVLHRRDQLVLPRQRRLEGLQL